MGARIHGSESRARKETEDRSSLIQVGNMATVCKSGRTVVIRSIYSNECTVCYGEESVSRFCGPRLSSAVDHGEGGEIREQGAG